MTRSPKPRKPARKAETIRRLLGYQNNATQRWLSLTGDHLNEVHSGLNRTRALLAELRQSLGASR